LTILMFITADDDSIGVNMVTEKESTIPESAGFTEETIETNSDDDNTSELMSWMWDQTPQARKKLGLPAKTAFKINKAHRAVREKKIAALIVREVSSQTRAKLGLVGSLRYVGMGKRHYVHTTGSHPLSTLLNTAEEDKKRNKSHEHQALLFVKQVVSTLSKQMIRRAKHVQQQKSTVLSQWMWDNKKTNAPKQKETKMGLLKSYHHYNLEKRHIRLRRIAQKIIDEAELEQKAALLKGDPHNRAKAEIAIASVNTASFLKHAQKKVYRQIQGTITSWTKIMLDEVALQQHATTNKAHKKVKSWGAKRKLKKDVDCLQQGDHIACATGRVKHEKYVEALLP